MGLFLGGGILKVPSLAPLSASLSFSVPQLLDEGSMLLCGAAQNHSIGSYPQALGEILQVMCGYIFLSSFTFFKKRVVHILNILVNLFPSHIVTLECSQDNMENKKAPLVIWNIYFYISLCFIL